MALMEVVLERNEVGGEKSGSHGIVSASSQAGWEAGKVQLESAGGESRGFTPCQEWRRGCWG